MNRFKTLASALVFGLAANGTAAERINVASDTSVPLSVDRLVKAVDAAGARVFTVVDFKQGASRMGEDLRPTTVVIFGSPKIGSTALQNSQTLALYLPLRILFHEDESGQTWATYDAPAAVAPTHGVAADNPAVLKMQAALERFAGIATGQ
jgi:uncharacterized protein (DUF302 family)